MPTIAESAIVHRVATDNDPKKQLQSLAPDPEGGLEGRNSSTQDSLLVYGTEKGVRVDVRYQGETLWMTQKQMGDLFAVSVPTISRHIANVIAEGELDDSTVAKIATVRREGDRQVERAVEHYSLDMIISVGYRVSSKQATLFRIWATERLKELILKGWSIDSTRLKYPDERDHLRELKEVIRDIRASEQNVYREVRSICALCQDYDPDSQEWRSFYARMQNTMLWAVAQMTGPEIVIRRADATKPNMGLTSWPHDNIRKADTVIANNYLGDAEIKAKNRLTVMLLDYFEDQVDQGRLVVMAEAERRLVEFVKFNQRPVLTHLGSVKREDANHHAEREFEKFKKARSLLQRDD